MAEESRTGKVSSVRHYKFGDRPVKLDTSGLSPKGANKLLDPNAKLKDFSPSKLNKFISKAGGALTIAKNAPGWVKIPVIAAVLGAPYLKDIKRWIDKRTGKTGKIPTVSVPTQLQGKRTPTQLRGKSSTPNNSSKSKGNPLDKFKTKTVHDGSREKLAHGGSVKKYARGGGIRKAKSYDY